MCIRDSDKAAPIAADQGATVAYSVTVSHDALASTGPAFDLLLADTLSDPNLAFDSGSVMVTGVAGAVITETGTGFEVAIPTLDVGESVTVTYTATLSATAPPAQSFPNTATLDFDSAPGPGGRMGMVSDDAIVSTVPVVDKQVLSSSLSLIHI